jgi:hypothetical protein
MAKLVRHLTSNEEIVSSNLAEGNEIFLIVGWVQNYMAISTNVSKQAPLKTENL